MVYVCDIGSYYCGGGVVYTVGVVVTYDGL